jgi:hypothetical protein
MMVMIRLRTSLRFWLNNSIPLSGSKLFVFRIVLRVSTAASHRATGVGIQIPLALLKLVSFKRCPGGEMTWIIESSLPI